ncbi:MAG: hypothetical protein EON47_14400 [Acetobacteraceae bacterium]|nr:MAG: hypothetical protein EON47_14400 [Acetobacteraceae bacterium]
MLIRSLPVAALLLGLAAAPAFAQTRPAEPPVTEAAARTLEQNRKVSVGLPPAATPRPAEARAVPPRRLALAAQR